MHAGRPPLMDRVSVASAHGCVNAWARRRRIIVGKVLHDRTLADFVCCLALEDISLLFQGLQLFLSIVKLPSQVGIFLHEEDGCDRD